MTRGEFINLGPGIFATETFLVDEGSILLVLCDRPFEADDYVDDENTLVPGTHHRIRAALMAACIACGSANQPYIDRIWDDRYGAPGIFSILKCTGCGQMVTSPPLTESDLPALYSRYYPRKNVRF